MNPRFSRPSLENATATKALKHGLPTLPPANKKALKRRPQGWNHSVLWQPRRYLPMIVMRRTPCALVMAIGIWKESLLTEGPSPGSLPTNKL